MYQITVNEFTQLWAVLLLKTKTPNIQRHFLRSARHLWSDTFEPNVRDFRFGTKDLGFFVAKLKMMNFWC